MDVRAAAVAEGTVRTWRDTAGRAYMEGQRQRRVAGTVRSCTDDSDDSTDTHLAQRVEQAVQRLSATLCCTDRS